MSEAEKRMREIYAQELDRDGEGMAAFLWRDSEPAHPDSSNGRIIRAMLAAEAAAIEKAAGYVEGAGGVIPGATVFAPLVSGNNMPCMSGDARDRLHPHKRRYFDDATKTLATAIRSLKEGASHVG